MAAEEHSTGGWWGSVFVGRARELGELRAGLAGAVSGHGCFFMVSGEPGIGKTRLVDELAADAMQQGVQVLWGRCWEGGGAPAFWPWVQIIRSYVRDRDPQLLAAQLGAGAPDVAQLVPEVRDPSLHLPALATADGESVRWHLPSSDARLRG